MTRQLSVDQIKRNQQQAGDGLPLEGTHLRALYDLFYRYRGHEVPYGMQAVVCGDDGKRAGGARLKLINEYGCDIRGRVLVGEWIGKIYLDYTSAAEPRVHAPISPAPAEARAAI